MLTIEGIELVNWKVYGGEQILALEPRPYALVARHPDNRDRSNALGKSSIPQAIAFALYGIKPPDCRLKGEWITRGEKFGKVKLHLFGGHTIERSQQLGKSEQLRFWEARVPEPARQDKAQSAIARVIGMSEEDFLACSYIRQKETSRFVTCDPAERHEIVTAWIRLEPLQRCQKIAAEDASELVATRDRLDVEVRARVVAANSSLMMAQSLLGVPVESIEQLKEQIQECRKQFEHAESLARAEEAAAAGAADYARLRGVAVRFDEVCEEGKALASQGSSPHAHQEAFDRLAATKKKFEQSVAIEANYAQAFRDATRNLASFDGHCPVINDECPARCHVEEQVDKRRNHHDSTRLNLADSRKFREQDAEALAQAQKAFDEVRDRQGRLKFLREEAKRLKPDADRFRSTAAPGPEDFTGRRMAEGFRRVLAELSTYLHQHEIALQEAAELRAKMAALEGDVALRLAGAKAFEGARREVAEGVLSDIQGIANGALAEAGIEFSMVVRWGREGTGVASSCQKCGRAFPRSERVKACECGEPRGPNVVEKLELVPSSRSGAADDLAGLFFQLGASRWLRGDRLTPWGVVMLDEVLAHCDREHRRAMTAALPRLLPGFGFDQALVIHHSSDVESFAAKIVVEGDGRRAVARVE